MSTTGNTNFVCGKCLPGYTLVDRECIDCRQANVPLNIAILVSTSLAVAFVTIKQATGAGFSILQIVTTGTQLVAFVEGPDTKWSRAMLAFFLSPFFFLSFFFFSCGLSALKSDLKRRCSLFFFVSQTFFHISDRDYLKGSFTMLYPGFMCLRHESSQIISLGILGAGPVVGFLSLLVVGLAWWILLIVKRRLFARGIHEVHAEREVAQPLLDEHPTIRNVSLSCRLRRSVIQLVFAQAFPIWMQWGLSMMFTIPSGEGHPCVVKAFAGVSCDDWYLKHVLWPIAFTLMGFVGFIGILLVVIPHCKTKYEEAWGILLAPYKTNRWWWGIMVCMNLFQDVCISTSLFWLFYA